ncbi:MAG: thioredoxin-dependent thiol peroxidase [Duncaniella sp.]|jgi:peroxiredoxin Q/BCP|uniref:thioredoxin-dependent thiol peroxidase n=1 Tax=Duncaniella muricolitica TaxID=2880704 RepID=UPI000A71A618|nr:thioredoxin-dependent thiol peroxidase [Duncaniella muricolitica]MDE5927346.1 thioredoxin-dependent thiol peroxidase [Duncaniella sp.]
METGTIIPDILGTDQDGNIIRRSDYPGRSIALYFYPKDSTSGCTAQACNLRDNYQSLLDAGYQVIGVSVDSADSHKKFIAKNSLPFPLITDTDHKLVTEFGVWGEKSMYGRKYMGTFRTTFIISPSGEVTRIITPKQVKTKDHAAQILAD